MTETARVTDEVYNHATELADERDLSIKEAIARMCREGGYDV